VVIALTKRFEDALIYATQLHANQFRKGTDTPYIAHLLSVTALVLEASGDEDLAIAALLHDAVEDQGGMNTLLEIKNRFGHQVAEIVLSCSDSCSTPKPPWRKRKESYLSKLRGSNPETRLISLADKVHNSRCLLRDLRIGKGMVWEKFNGGKEGTLWYYLSLVSVFEEFEENYLLEELKRIVGEINFIATYQIGGTEK
jgi:(p)ppGpp synthase/HD superfamily hydrolase